ncbi:hypothetical protein ABGB18_28910 [Nonomuraea sp. B12E4]|uniref:hypothetical protein n=1 Tax=Nonomuraea sp. B12E4 TaxID=3153564 RepID=UPI00325F8834
MDETSEVRHRLGLQDQAQPLNPGPRAIATYVEATGCYGHNGADDCAADAAVLSQAAGKPVRVQWTRQDEHGWEPLGGAQAHDMRGAVGPDGITAWSHLLIINPDGLRNQIEGNVVQGVSRTLKEEVSYTDDRVTSLVWQSSSFNPGPQYEVVRFNEVPVIETILIDHPDQPPLGAGEPTIGTMAGAIANAIFAATGKRLRTLPFTPDRVKAALSEQHTPMPSASPAAGRG